jgi:ribosomal protein S18 acetylase RimI-like enzyme
MYLHDQILFLESVVVSPAMQGRGVGRAHMNYAENVAIQKDVNIRLYTNTKMYENIAMYQNLSYKVIDTRQEDGYSRIFFEKSIAK